MKFLISNLYFISSFPFTDRNSKILNYFSCSASMNRGKRLTDVQGYENRKNSIYFYPTLKNNDNKQNFVKNSVIFFGGDGQDYLETMEQHRENRRHSEWNIEKTAEIISKKFPYSNVLYIKPAKMLLGIFNSYSNFVPSKDYGIPEFRPDNKAWSHLRILIESSYKEVFGSLADSIQQENRSLSDDAKIVLIGFSKGCVVLNQLIWELPSLDKKSLDAQLVNRVTDFYWLDGGHGGGKDTWVTNTDQLKSLAFLNCRIHAHVTPYQVHDTRRPYLGKEYKKFCEHLSKLKTNDFFRKIHFENEDASLENHFKLLTVFEEDKTD